MLMLLTVLPLRMNFAERLLNHDTITSSDLSVEVIVLRGNDLHWKGVLSYSCRSYCPQLKVNLIIMASKIETSRICKT